MVQYNSYNAIYLRSGEQKCSKLLHVFICLVRVVLFEGITPKITNEVGLNCELTFRDGADINPKGSLAAAQRRKLQPGMLSIAIALFMVV